jgi:hypothetical protein
MKRDKCGDRLTTTDGRGPDLDLTCERDGRTHVVHKDSAGNKYIRVPGGSLVSGPKPK